MNHQCYLKLRFIGLKVSKPLILVSEQFPLIECGNQPITPQHALRNATNMIEHVMHSYGFWLLRFLHLFPAGIWINSKICTDSGSLPLYECLCLQCLNVYLNQIFDVSIFLFAQSATKWTHFRHISGGLEFFACRTIEVYNWLHVNICQQKMNPLECKVCSTWKMEFCSILTGSFCL